MAKGKSGEREKYKIGPKIRNIVIAEGIQFHESDFDERNKRREKTINNLKSDPKYYEKAYYYKNSKKVYWLKNKVKEKGWTGTDNEISQKLIELYKSWTEYSALRYLELKLGKKVNSKGEKLLDVSNRKDAVYRSISQNTKYILKVVHKKSEFKKALEDKNNDVVIYAGHSRYGRGACFDQYPKEYTKTGNRWEDGDRTDKEDGLFRLGYPYVPVPLGEIKTHQYKFTPVPVKKVSSIQREKRHPFSRHPSARRKLIKISLPNHPFDFNKYVKIPLSTYYYGYKEKDKVDNNIKTYIILKAHWKGTINLDLGATTIGCETFCHFGCSSSRHFWYIIRHKKYKKWTPHSKRSAFFTSATGDWRGCCYWLYHLLNYPELKEDKKYPMRWPRALWRAKFMANKDLKKDRKRGKRKYYITHLPVRKS